MIVLERSLILVPDLFSSTLRSETPSAGVSDGQVPDPTDRPTDRGPLTEVLTCLESEPETTNYHQSPPGDWIRRSFIFIPIYTPLQELGMTRNDSVTLYMLVLEATSWASIPCPKSWCYHRGCSRPPRLDTPRSRMEPFLVGSIGEIQVALEGIHRWITWMFRMECSAILPQRRIWIFEMLDKRAENRISQTDLGEEKRRSRNHLINVTQTWPTKVTKDQHRGAALPGPSSRPWSTATTCGRCEPWNDHKLLKLGGAVGVENMAIPMHHNNYGNNPHKLGCNLRILKV